MQALLIGFIRSFIEGCRAGSSATGGHFGVFDGIGFSQLYDRRAGPVGPNTAPVAFGALGTPIITVGQNFPGLDRWTETGGGRAIARCYR